MDRKTTVIVLAVTALSLIVGVQQLLARTLPPPGQPASAIRLKAAVFDPLSDQAPAVPDRDAKSKSAGQATYLIQFAGPVREEWKSAAENAGARLYGYIPDNAFIARLDAFTADKLRSLSFVRWVGPYHSGYRLSPDLSSNAIQSTYPTTVTVEALPDVVRPAVAGQIEALGGSIIDQGGTPIASYLRILVPADRLADLSALDGILWVEGYFSPRVQNDVAAGTIMRAGTVRQELGLYGSGQTVAVADTGLDVGTTGSAVSDDFEGRISSGIAMCANVSGGRTTWDDKNAHGTHVAGSVLGSGKLSGSNPMSHSYSGSFAGVAPEANLVFQAVQDSDGSLRCIPADLASGLFFPAYDLGARIHTNSWGGATGTSANPYGGYTASAQQADSAMWQKKDLLLLFAAGNEGVDANSNGLIDPDSMNSPGTAKNVITVGASENVRTSLNAYTWGNLFSGNPFPANPINGDPAGNNASGLAAFSSRGPTDDGRIKPDIVAPGTWIVSARSHASGAGNGWMSYSGNSHYVYMGGTSMATPLTAGAATIVREWLTRIRSVANPSGALLKALLLNGAVDMTPGQYGTGSAREIPAVRPNSVEGYGRVDLVQTIDPPSPLNLWFADNTTGISTGGTATYTLSVGNSQAQASQQAPLSGSTTARADETPRAGPAVQSQEQLSSPAAAALPPLQFSQAAVASAAPVAASLTPLGTANLLQDAGFESGSWTGSAWTVTATGPSFSNSAYNGSSWSMHFGGAAYGGSDEIAQTVAIPSDAVSATIQLHFKWSTAETGSASGDTLIFGLWPEQGSTAYAYAGWYFGYLGNQYGRNPTGWYKETYNLTDSELAAVKGKTVKMVFQTYNDAFYVSEAWIDDTALYVNRPSTATPTATPTLTSTPTATGTATATSTATTTGTATATATVGSPTQTSTTTATGTRTSTATNSPTATATVATGGPLSITLAYSDYPGEPAAAKALVNDLDLEVIAPDGTHYYGNQGVYTSGSCLRSSKWDACNPVEGMVIPRAVYGTYTVVVHGYQVAQGTKQPFALVATGDYLQEATAEQATATPTPSQTATSTATSSTTATRSPTATVTATSSPTATATRTATATATETRVPAPIVYSIDPTSGSTSAKTSVTIRGTRFSLSAQAALASGGSTHSLTDIEVRSASTIAGNVPAGLAAGAYDVVVTNRDGQSGRLSSAFAIAGSAPLIRRVFPSQGAYDVPNQVTIDGSNFREGVTVEVTKDSASASLANVHRSSSSRIEAVVPAGLAAGIYDVIARNSDALSNPGSLSQGYTVLSNTLDLFVDDDDIWTDPVTVRQGDTVRLGVNLRRRGGQTTVQVPVRFYLGDPDAGGTVIGDVTTAPIPPSTETESAFVSWPVGNQTAAVEVMVVVDPDSTITEITKGNNRASRSVAILPPAGDSTPPEVTGLVLAGGAAQTTVPQIGVVIGASDNAGGSGVANMYLVEREFSTAARAWIPIQTTGWVSFTSPYTLTLTDRAGHRYIQAYVADAAGNISLNVFKTQIDYVPATDTLLAYQVRLYRRTLGIGDSLTVRVVPQSGDADLYVWGPSGNNLLVSAASGTAVDEGTVTATEAGIHQIEVFAYTDTTYTLTISSGAAAAFAVLPQAVRPNEGKVSRTSPVVPATNEPEGQMAVPGAPIGSPSSAYYRVYLPVTVRAYAGGW
ncbi:MAG: S8 family serine peptidase [Chloroflexi bacterium]|nr:S8 family serine peptidase [Chloroflexota bacterium]